MKQFRKTLIATSLVLLGIALLALAADHFFKIYERRALIREVDQNALVFDLAEYGYNDHGPPLAREEEPGEFRILSIGTSYTLAVTKPQYTYSAVLERDLNRMSGGRRVRVVNLGVGGISFPEYMAHYLFWSKILKFDAVVFNVYLGSSFVDVLHRPYDPGLLALKTLATGIGAALPHVWRLRFFDYVYAYVRASRHAKPADDHYNLSYQVPWDQYLLTMGRAARVYCPAELPRFATGVDWAGHFMAFVKRIEDSGVKVAVMVSSPHLFFNERLYRETLASMGAGPGDVDPELPVFLMRELARRQGLAGEILDPSPCLALHAKRGQELFYGTDTHWNVQGNQVVGDYLADALAGRWFAQARGPMASDCPPGIAAPQASDLARKAALEAIEKHGF